MHCDYFHLIASTSASRLTNCCCIPVHLAPPVRSEDFISTRTRISMLVRSRRREPFQTFEKFHYHSLLSSEVKVSIFKVLAWGVGGGGKKKGILDTWIPTFYRSGINIHISHCSFSSSFPFQSSPSYTRPYFSDTRYVVLMLERNFGPSENH